MIGLVYLKLNNKIISLIKNVQSHTSDSIIGIDSSVKGIDLSQAIICTVSDSSTLQVGDILNDTVAILASAQNAKITQIEQSYNDTISAGFASSASGVAKQYAYDPIVDQPKWMKLALMVAKNKVIYPVSIAAKDDTIATYTQAQYEQLESDINSWEWVQENKLHNLLAQVKAATTVSAVNAIVW